MIKDKTAELEIRIDDTEGKQKPLRILLAEDNPVNQKVTWRMLKNMGYLAEVVSNGSEVLQAIEQRPYDVILMDVTMPEMDGLEATRRIRQLLPHEKQPKIIAITALASHGDREMCLDAGMDYYLSKPIQPEQLRNALKDIY
ncbi:MAG TPA: response regulator [Methanotrichaceae archaeon]|nr:response regulator [Methanotrichaceae archaeon]